MLVLSRKQNQSVHLFDKRTGQPLGEVLVTELRGGSVRLGFAFDETVGISRDSLPPSLTTRPNSESEPLVVL